MKNILKLSMTIAIMFIIAFSMIGCSNKDHLESISKEEESKNECTHEGYHPNHPDCTHEGYHPDHTDCLFDGCHLEHEECTHEGYHPNHPDCTHPGYHPDHPDCTHEGWEEKCEHSWEKWTTALDGDTMFQLYRCTKNKDHVKYEVIDTETSNPDQPTEEPGKDFVFVSENIFNTSWYSLDAITGINFYNDFTFTFGETTGTWTIFDNQIKLTLDENISYVLTFDKDSNALVGTFNDAYCTFILRVI